MKPHDEQVLDTLLRHVVANEGPSHDLMQRIRADVAGATPIRDSPRSSPCAPPCAARRDGSPATQPRSLLPVVEVAPGRPIQPMARFMAVAATLLISLFVGHLVSFTDQPVVAVTPGGVTVGPEADPGVSNSNLAADIEASQAARQLRFLAEAYRAVHQQNFVPSPEMDTLENLANAFIAKWTDNVPAAVLATARTYRVRSLLTTAGRHAEVHGGNTSKHAEILRETAAVLAIAGLSEDDAYKLYYYRGLAAIALDRSAIVAECAEKLAVIKPDIGALLEAAIARQSTPVTAGQMAPLWTLPCVKHGTENGTAAELALESLRGQYVLLAFWATWSGSCKSLMASELFHIHGEWANDDRFELVGVGTNRRHDTAVMQADYAREMDYHWTNVFDATGSVTDDHGVRGIPTLTFISPAGTVIVHGYRHVVLPVVKETLSKLAAERAPGTDGEPGEPELEEEDF